MKRIAVDHLRAAAAPSGPQPLADDVGLADGWWSRLRGLIGRPPLQAGQGLWILPCQQVHTHFMGAPIDVVFVDPAGRVLRVLRGLKPWRFSPWVRGARAVLELPAGGAQALAEGDQLLTRPRHAG